MRHQADLHGSKALRKRRADTAIRLFAAVAVLGGMAAAPALAGSIGPTCTSCQGGVYTLTYNPAPLQTSAHWDLWEIALTVDSRGFNGDPEGSANDYIDQVAFKISSHVATNNAAPQPRLSTFEVISGTSAFSLSNWSGPNMGGLNATGCNGSGSGFICVDYVKTGTLPERGIPVNGIYRWTFEVPVSLGGLFTQSQYLTQDASIKARYVSASGDKVGSLVSEDLRLTPDTLTAVPEPVSAVLLLTVIAGVALTFRKSLRS
jgi:hypothetical protein